MSGPPLLDDLIRRSADPRRSESVLERLGEIPTTVDRLIDDPTLAERVVAVAAASGWMGRLIVTDPVALDVLAEPESPVAEHGITDASSLDRWRRLEHLRLAASDLTGALPLDETMAALSDVAARVLHHALTLGGADHLAVIALGKAGGRELNYSSDVDVVIVAPDDGAGAADTDDARRALAIARGTLRIDVDLRPEGRDGALVRTLDGYRAHWDRWAEPWERQALLKARPVAGDASLGRAFADAASTAVWERPFDAEAIRSVRAMKAQTEHHATVNDGPLDLKRTPGGIRDIEFSAQLLQLVHGPLDPALRVGGTIPALTALAEGGYVDGDDASRLRDSYVLFRRIEHAVQLDEGHQTHAVPSDPDARRRVSRMIGLSSDAGGTDVEHLDRDVATCRSTVRSIHERWYFRPLLDAFTDVDAPLSAEAAATRLHAFGFADAERTRQAVTELTRGLTRSSRLMASLLPLVLDWLSASPDPDRGLLALRTLVGHHATAVAGACRESPETARRLSIVAGTSPVLMRGLELSPDLLADLASPDGDRDAVMRRVHKARDTDPDRVRQALRRAVRREKTRIGLADVLDVRDQDTVGSDLATVAHAAVDVAVDTASPDVPLAVLAVGRLAGGELSYASDLDLVIVHDADDADGRDAALHAGDAVRRLLVGTGPADRVYEVDLDLRPGGRSGPVVTSREALVAHLERWIEPWQRLALTRLRPLSGDADVARRVLAAAEPLVWRPVTADDLRAVRRVKARGEAERPRPGEDPRFHLKLGPGALTDVEITVALLAWVHGIREVATESAIAALADAGHLSSDEAEALAASVELCTRARNRWTLMSGQARDALPTGPELTALARSLDTTGPALRESYLRVTRRARHVVEDRLYGSG